MTHFGHRRAGFRFRNLLVPTDLTASSDRVLGRVARLPLSHGCRLTLLHVVADELPVRIRLRAERDAMRLLAEEARQLAEALPDGVEIEPVVTAGPAATEIATQSVATGAEMIVMGRVGGRPLREMFLGSTAERVLRRAKLPVLTVRLPPRSAYRRPAIALAADQAADRALAQLLKVVPVPRPDVTVIHAYDTLHRRLASSGLSREAGAEVRDNARRAAIRAVARLLESALAAAKVRPVDAPTWKTHVQLDAPRLVIAKAVSKFDLDLLVLGTRGRAGLAYAFLGTLAGEILRTVSCDVLVVPPSRSRTPSTLHRH